MKWEAPIWRLVTSKVATLQELESVYSHDDVLRAVAILDFNAEIERVCMQDVQKEPKK